MRIGLYDADGSWTLCCNYSPILLALDFKTGVRVSRVTFRLNIERRYHWYSESIQMNHRHLKFYQSFAKNR